MTAGRNFGEGIRLIDLLTSLGAWNWAILGIVLLLLELVFPGVFLVWFGLGGLLTALIAMFFSGSALIATWEVETLLFLIFSVILVFVGRNFFRRDRETDEPLLNRRTDQIIGRMAILEEPVLDGQGRVRVDDTIWRVKGPDLPSGTQVRLIAFKDGVFIIEKV